MTTQTNVLKLVQGELERITDHMVHSAIEALLIVSPVVHQRFWNTEVCDAPFICWTVAEDPINDNAYIYCEDGLVSDL